MEPMRESELSLRDLKDDIDRMCPVRLYINDKLIWDDFKDDIKVFNDALDSDKIVKCIVYEIVEAKHY
jgi:hypothetical protein